VRSNKEARRYLKGLVDRLPRIPLAHLPTPLDHCPRIFGEIDFRAFQILEIDQHLWPSGYLLLRKASNTREHKEGTYYQ